MIRDILNHDDNNIGPKAATAKRPTLPMADLKDQ